MSLLHKLKAINEYGHRLQRWRGVLFEVMNGFGFHCQMPVIDALRAHPHIQVRITTSGLSDEPLCRQHIMDSPHACRYIPPQ